MVFVELGLWLVSLISGDWCLAGGLGVAIGVDVDGLDGTVAVVMAAVVLDTVVVAADWKVLIGNLRFVGLGGNGGAGREAKSILTLFCPGFIRFSAPMLCSSIDLDNANGGLCDDGLSGNGLIVRIPCPRRGTATAAVVGVVVSFKLLPMFCQVLEHNLLNASLNSHLKKKTPPPPPKKNPILGLDIYRKSNDLSNQTFRSVK